MSKQMKAMVIDDFGGSDVFRSAVVDIPDPKPGHVLIREAYASVNPADWKARAGLLRHIHHDPRPIIVGLDASGIIEKVGEGVTGFAPGDRVVTLSGFGMGEKGTYAEYCTAPASRTAILPDSISLVDGATIPIASASAGSTIIDVVKPQAGDLLFFNGGSGSVGTFGIQLAKLLGVRVAATCSTRNLEYVRGLGADLVIDYTKEDVFETLQAWAPDGLDSMIDAIGQDSLPANMADLIKAGGILCCIINLVKDVACYDVAAAAERGVRVIDNGVRHLQPPAMYQVEGFRRILAAVGRGEIRPAPYEVVPLEQVGRAHDRVADGHVRGKILLKIADLEAEPR